LLQILKAMQVQISTYTHVYVTFKDENCIIQAEMRTKQHERRENSSETNLKWLLGSIYFNRDFILWPWSRWFNV